jgi:cation diffusion facilitator CzcD-associated flavoprotein CzcO
MTNSCDAIIVGAGPAGLAVAAALKARGRDAIILEKSAAVGSVWRRHYDRLHLHTDRIRSGLPGLAMPIAYGRYPSRLQVVEYLEGLCGEIRPQARVQHFGQRNSPGWKPVAR